MVFIINMRVFKTVFTLLLTITSCVNAGPASFLRLEHRTDDDSASLPDNFTDGSTASPTKDTYDQRQNGTENYRIHVDGFFVVVAPVEAILLAGAVAGSDNDLLSGLAGLGGKPQESKPQDSKPISKPGDDKPGDDKPGDDKPGDDKPVDGKPAEDKPTDEKPAEKTKSEASLKKSVSRPHVKLVSFLTPLLRRIVQH
ncbi:uncharacterized protein LOC130665728 [Microplitis mediator]|uniref:uncharacterized protein LOC130665728 n=1 Tax=Microplitis mediator TaxID=375433 RepID=UPI00255210B8|nr:uncharacterized protein LOC130665728 [Microplitis mediator]